MTQAPRRGPPRGQAPIFGQNGRALPRSSKAADYLRSFAEKIEEG